MRGRLELAILIAILFAIAFLLTFAHTAEARCHDVDVTVNTPSGIGGCYHWGRGDASQYTETGWGAAMNYCTYSFRVKHGCGSVRVISVATGRAAIVPVVDFCDCYQRPGPNGERLRYIDLQGDVVRALGLKWWNINPVKVWPAAGERSTVREADSAMTPLSALPNTAMR